MYWKEKNLKMHGDFRNEHYQSSMYILSTSSKSFVLLVHNLPVLELLNFNSKNKEIQ